MSETSLAEPVVAPEATPTKPAQDDGSVLGPLTLNDRCDSCGETAQAFVRIQFEAGTLDLCGHHYARFQDKIDETALMVFDNRAAINEKPSVSANSD